MKKFKILLSNDDGIHAEGLRTLQAHLSDQYDVWVVAPSEERSTTGHTLTLDRPVFAREIGVQEWSCSGHPADCSFLALDPNKHLFAAKKNWTDFDLVISGINYGPNLGQDTYYSGTVAAAREAYFRGVNSIAISLALNFQDKDGPRYYSSAAQWLERFLGQVPVQDYLRHKAILKMPILWNINIPNKTLTELDSQKAQVTDLGLRLYSSEVEKRLDCRQRDYYWFCGQLQETIELPGSDGACIAQGAVSLSVLNYLPLERWRWAISLQENNKVTKDLPKESVLAHNKVTQYDNSESLRQDLVGLLGS